MGLFRKTGSVVVIIGLSLLLVNFKKVGGKSVSSIDPTTDFTYTETTKTSPSTSTVKSTQPNNVLNETFHSVVFKLTSKHEQAQFFLGNSETNAGFKIAVHLKDCSYSRKEFIELVLPSGQTIAQWKCNDAKDDSKEDEDSSSREDDRLINEFQTKHTGESYVNIDKVVDNLTEIIIRPNFIRTSDEGLQSHRGNDNEKATVVINIYKDLDIGESCPSNYFNCKAPVCTPRCCSDAPADDGMNHGHSSGRNYQVETEGNTFEILERWGVGIKSKRQGQQQGARCIHHKLKCDGDPNCGMYRNTDEMNEVCHPYLCPCQKLCLTWNYVLTSLAIAVLFIITPTTIVFALFHRRNVALERARLIRLAQARMAEMRSELTQNSPANDLPPTYDEVYDTKEPPPCFCQATMEEMEEGEGTGEDLEEAGAVGPRPRRHCSCVNENTEGVNANQEQNETDSGQLRNSRNPSAPSSNTPEEVGIDALHTIRRESNLFLNETRAKEQDLKNDDNHSCV